MFEIGEKIKLEIIKSKEWIPGYCPEENFMYRLTSKLHSLPIVIVGEISLEDLNLKGLCVCEKVEPKQLAIISVRKSEILQCIQEMYIRNDIKIAKITCTFDGKFDLNILYKLLDIKNIQKF